VPHTPVVFPTERVCPFDPPPELETLRERRPVARLRYPDGEVGWLVTRHDLVRAVFGDARFSSRTSFLFPVAAADPVATAQLELVRSELEGVMEVTDPPEHGRLRRVHTAFFTSARVGKRRPQLERAVDDAFDALASAGPRTDLVREFVLPACALMTCAFLDVSWDDPQTLRRLLETSRALHRDAAGALAAHEAFTHFVREVIEEKRGDPGGGVLAHLARSEELGEEELVGAVRTLFRDGTQNTAVMLAASIFALLGRRERWEALRLEPGRLEETTEELLRYLTVFQTISTRRALDDVELDGVPIRAGERVSVSLSAANRDPRRFSDPDTFDATRAATGHLAFGYGRHVCLGQHLVRLELQVALARLVDRFPGMTLATPLDEVRVATDSVAWSVPALLVDLEG
jgi:cytochrome P450